MSFSSVLVHKCTSTSITMWMTLFTICVVLLTLSHSSLFRSVCCYMVQSMMSSLSPRLVILSRVIDSAVFLSLNDDRVLQKIRFSDESFLCWFF